MSSENHHYFYHQNLQIHRRTTFLPMLCARPSSMKDVSLPQWRDQAGSFSNDPLSPRIGCMGQVKRHNKILGLLTTKTTTTTNINIISPSVNYAKLKKLFSAKNLATTTTTRPRGTENSGNVPRSHNKHMCKRNENVVPIRIENMDLPLPVIKRVQKPEEERQVDTLWKRRSGGAALKTLQLQQIHRSRHHPQLTSV
ncbi:hypothetical protein LR48_Vigan462s003100 [Vigna angularis]|uniref:Uncharacterized protein n=2 Tax=Phaseolus angularis TaxID=3914 RepID=A0A0L9TB49_PHAAN|nr:uncharacterized protein LOC108320988 [Vigna angularis]KAG2389873.1 uncharacterized protein HKW66_Vig0179460 [Vigna angularis]KOM27778.1 hypothetical protein LR48_Vigan462s003100 [Vigna angularis]BAT82088.1 hypothetical protein VIGAN_03204300 [Vigna angularis var. angularis]